MEENSQPYIIPIGKCLTFSLGQAQYAIALHDVQEVVGTKLNVTALNNAPESVKGKVELRGQTYILVDLRVKLKIDNRANPRCCSTVILKNKEVEVAILVDEVNSVELFREQDLSPFIDDLPNNVEFIKGAFRKHARPILILDLDKILNIEEIKKLNVPHRTSA